MSRLSSFKLAGGGTPAPQPGNAWYRASDDQSKNYAEQIAKGLWDSTVNTVNDIVDEPLGAVGSRAINAVGDLGAAATNTLANAWNSNPLFRTVSRATGHENAKIPNVTSPDVIYNPRNSEDTFRLQGGSVERDPARGTPWSLGMYVPGDPLRTVGRVLEAASLIPAVKGVKVPKLKVGAGELKVGSPEVGPSGNVGTPGGTAPKINSVKIPPTSGAKISPIKIGPADLSPLPPRGGFRPGPGSTATLTKPKVQPKTKPLEWPKFEPDTANPEYQIVPKTKAPVDAPDALAPKTNLTPSRVRLLTPTEELSPEGSLPVEPKPESRTPRGTKTIVGTDVKDRENKKPKPKDAGDFDASVGYQNVHPLTTW